VATSQYTSLMFPANETHLEGHIVDHLGKHSIQLFGRLRDDVIWSIEPGGIPEDLPHIQRHLGDTIVPALALVPLAHLALILWWTPGITDDQFRLDSRQVHRVGDDLRVGWNVELDRVDRFEKEYSILVLLQASDRIEHMLVLSQGERCRRAGSDWCRRDRNGDNTDCWCAGGRGCGLCWSWEGRGCWCGLQGTRMIGLRGRSDERGLIGNDLVIS
jgi:hypothetical protein